MKCRAKSIIKWCLISTKEERISTRLKTKSPYISEINRCHSNKCLSTSKFQFSRSRWRPYRLHNQRRVSMAYKDNRNTLSRQARDLFSRLNIKALYLANTFHICKQTKVIINRCPINSSRFSKILEAEESYTIKNSNINTRTWMIKSFNRDRNLNRRNLANALPKGREIRSKPIRICLRKTLSKLSRSPKCVRRSSLCARSMRVWRPHISTKLIPSRKNSRNLSLRRQISKQRCWRYAPSSKHWIRWSRTGSRIRRILVITRRMAWITLKISSSKLRA